MLTDIFKRTKTPASPKLKVMGQKPPLKLKEIWAIRMHLQLTGQLRELLLFNLAIDSKLRACDLVKLRVQDVYHAGQAAKRAVVMQHDAARSVRDHGAGLASHPGFGTSAFRRATISSRAGSSRRRTCRDGSTRGSWPNGFLPSALTRVSTALTPCAGPRPR